MDNNLEVRQRSGFQEKASCAYDHPNVQRWLIPIYFLISRKNMVIGQLICCLDYTKKRNVFRLRTSDRAEFLFQTSDEQVISDYTSQF